MHNLISEYISTIFMPKVESKTGINLLWAIVVCMNEFICLTFGK